MRIVIAPDSFTGTLDAPRAAAAIARGWTSVRPDDDLVAAPLADGGDGTLDIVAAAVPGATFHAVPGCTGPDGRPVTGRWLALPDGRAVVDLTQVVGPGLMAAPDPLGASSRGLGEVLAAALDAGASALTVVLGEAAATDGGAGALSALGLVLLDGSGTLLPDGGGALARLELADMTDLRRGPPGGVTLLTDARTPLLGPLGAAHVGGAGAGASPAQVALLETGLDRLAAVLGGAPQALGAGAGGGAGYGIAVAWRATIVPGAAFLAGIVGLPALLEGADVLLTGEARVDGTSLSGTAVGAALTLADRGAHVRTGVLAGAIGDAGTLDDRGTWHCSLTDLAGSAAAALAEPERWLSLAAARAARARQILG